MIARKPTRPAEVTGHTKAEAASKPRAAELDMRKVVNPALLERMRIKEQVSQRVLGPQ
jgi:hypothetical protein